MFFINFAPMTVPVTHAGSDFKNFFNRFSFREGVIWMPKRPIWRIEMTIFPLSDADIGFFD
jgi:hypothetical protein